jgi:hypothetical protein
MLVDPLGVPVAALGEAEGVATGTVSNERIADVRTTNRALSHRRWAVTPSLSDEAVRQHGIKG